MISFIISLLRKLGVDKAILFTSLGRTIQAVGGVISVLFVARFLTETEQGFYYTFGSIVAIQIFFELGLNGIITQYVAHEASHLKWVNKTVLTGDLKYLSRLSSLLRFAAKWYIWFATILLITLVIVGFVFFTKFDSGSEVVNWKTPWLLLSVGTAINLLIAPILAFLEGLGKVKEVAQIRLCHFCIVLLVVCTGLGLGAKLYVPGLNSIVGVFIVLITVLLSSFKPILSNIWKVPITEKVNYKREIFPYQWKIALSWMSGYFIFHLFNPVLFAVEGAVVAGQMGMTLAALNGILSISLSWMTTKVPTYSGLIAQKNYKQLDIIFNRTLKQSVFINASGLFCVFVIIFVIRYFQFEIGGLKLGNRFLDYIPMILMMIPLLINQFVNSWAIYLRCHKKEPFLINSIAGGIACCLSTVLLGKYFGVMGVTAGYCTLSICFLPWAYYIFKTKKDEWHGRK